MFIIKNVFFFNIYIAGMVEQRLRQLGDLGSVPKPHVARPCHFGLKKNIWEITVNFNFFFLESGIIFVLPNHVAWQSTP